jgi:ubiquinol-cytochrome c reductase cytochrome b subunit
MRDLIHQAIGWIEHRTGFETACRRFLLEDIPASAGWPQVFGSIAVFLFLTQALTGVLLAFDYAPTPGDAYHSVVYVLRKVAAGRMVRGLHHWGASFMIIVVFLHMAQVFIYGAYKKPREATWIVGVVLLVLTLAFGLTGYLLPWDNRAYWGTMVTTRIIGSIPFAGSFLLRLIGAANGIGVLTFSRFYAVHTLLLPATMALLVVVHIYLVRRHGITSSATNLEDTQKFYPKQAFRDVLAVFITFVILFAAAAFLEVPLERLADPTDTSYTPRPEWYFLFLFQLLRILQGPLEPVGTVVLPSVAVLVLFLLPFVHSSRFHILNGRVMSAGIVVLVFAIWGGLTVAATLTTPANKRLAFVPPEAVEWTQVPPEEIAGIGYFRSSRCDSCHNLLTGTPKPGPNLASAELHHPKEWLIQHFKNPRLVPSDNGVSPTRLSLPQLNALSLFIANLTPDSADVLQAVPPDFIMGAQTFVVGACGSCHKVNGIGGGVGPPLNGLAGRRTKQWVEEHFVSPQRLSPGSIMPPYHFAPAEEEAIVLYLFSLPD